MAPEEAATWAARVFIVSRTHATGRSSSLPGPKAPSGNSVTSASSPRPRSAMSSKSRKVPWLIMMWRENGSVSGSRRPLITIIMQRLCDSLVRLILDRRHDCAAQLLVEFFDHVEVAANPRAPHHMTGQQQVAALSARHAWPGTRGLCRVSVGPNWTLPDASLVERVGA